MTFRVQASKETYGGIRSTYLEIAGSKAGRDSISPQLFSILY